MDKSERLLDIKMLFNSLRGAALLGEWHYCLYFIGHEIVVCFHANYLDKGFDEFIKDLKNLSIFKWSNLSDTILVFDNPMDV